MRLLPASSGRERVAHALAAGRAVAGFAPEQPRPGATGRAGLAGAGGTLARVAAPGARRGWGRVR